MWGRPCSGKTWLPRTARGSVQRTYNQTITTPFSVAWISSESEKGTLTVVKSQASIITQKTQEFALIEVSTSHRFGGTL